MEKILAENLKFLRKHHGFNLLQMAEKLGISKSSISDYENGKFIPNFEVIGHYCQLFSIEMKALGEVKLNKDNWTSFTSEAAARQSEEYKILLQKYQLLEQKLDGLRVQNTLLQQLMESKESELKTLKLQVELLMNR